MINLLWDLDGTVIDSAPVIARCLNETCKYYGQTEQTDEDLMAFIGAESGQSLALLLGLENQDDISEAKQLYRSFYARDMLKSSVFDGICEVLEYFRLSGARQYIATAKYQQSAMQIVDAFELDSQFVAVYGAEEDGRLGVKQDLLEYILSEEALDAANTIMIGDTRFDIEAGRIHDLSTIGVLWGYGGRAALEGAGAHFLAETPQQMPDIIRQAVTCGC